MSEIRKHYFLPEYCIISEERAKRPSDFAEAVGDSEELGRASCAFCEGAEEMTPLATAVYKDGKILVDTDEKRVRSWDFRCFPNRYPALSPVPAFFELSENVWETRPGFGFHEVIVESPVHGNKLANFSDKELSGLMGVYRDRTSHYRAHENIRYVSLFKNSGKAAGASLNHPHSQLLALPLLPPLLEKELHAIREEEKCPYCTLLEKERTSERLIRENSEWTAFAPYCSASPFEVWVLPKKHVSWLGDCSEEALFSLGEMLRDVLRAYEKVLKNPPYNYMFFQLFETPEYHLNLRLLPRLSRIAGFEMNTGIYINTISPERAASYLKRERRPGE
ncbi:DUF4921 family protein [Methanosarcina sp. KYL-1]|uniref:galactose-1-phosphate uridylyltransferase n=1 Tax=Methanosarcina sp. KYL-1 TaxID=2602068 RepID=UPI00210140E1|nr:DUF4921 family protein [Methanosarcina sp. KYL-1]MCQ1535266.1 DUF4921 family protein [Methanosarcina sp. KYL-1]